MKASRKKIYNEQLPIVEINPLGKRFQVCYNFEEVEKEDDTLFQYDYVNVNDNSRDTIISAIIRKRYTADMLEAIINNFLNNEKVIDYLIMQNYRKFAKAVADQDEDMIDATKQATCHKVVLPFNETLHGGDYALLSDRMLKVKMNYEVNLYENQAVAYPSWISDGDLQALQSDPRVEIKTIKLYE